MQKGVASVFYPTIPPLQKDCRGVPLIQNVAFDPALEKGLCSIDVDLGHRFDNFLDLGVTTGVVDMQAASVDLWH